MRGDIAQVRNGSLPFPPAQILFFPPTTVLQSDFYPFPSHSFLFSLEMKGEKRRDEVLCRFPSQYPREEEKEATPVPCVQHPYPYTRPPLRITQPFFRLQHLNT